MSTSSESALIWGIPLTRRKVTETVTRYDEKSGEPYQIEVSMSRFKKPNGEWLPDEIAEQFRYEEEDQLLAIHDIDGDYCQAESKHIFGLKVSSINSYSDERLCPVTVEGTNRRGKEEIAALEKAGILNDAQLYLVNHVSG